MIQSKTNMLHKLSKEELLIVFQSKLHAKYNLLLFDWIDWLSTSRPYLRSLLELEAYEQCCVHRDDYERELKTVTHFLFLIDSKLRYTSEEWVEECLKKITRIVDKYVVEKDLKESDVETSEEILSEFAQWATDKIEQAEKLFLKDPDNILLNKYLDCGLITNKLTKQQLIKEIQTS